ncbi:hypothetical protein CMV_027289 [Castanea mollissima]|uniref:Disease resistance protein RPS4B/Roq1-like leucine-rich repeats domain-containing protein n=1 Tax=Castanea mollissima TaxID=60419 RepID=A0A8J4QIH6_9ROSI|nr:hypothetical protein CMV_027289 [Castanea mollissima]
MAWRVVHRESPKKPGRRSRLWFCKDVFHVLKENTGTKFVEGMLLNSPPHEENLNDKAFSNMINLSFQPDNLVELIMPRSHIKQLPEGFGNLAKLRLMDLSDSQNLVKTPNFIRCPDLQRLIFRDYFFPAPCPEQDSINLPLPMSFGLSSLVSLDLSDCNLSDGALPDDLSCFSSLEVLKLNKNNFTSLPDSISQLSKLTCLHLENCTQLQSLPNLPLSVSVNVRGCTSLENYSDKVVQWNLPQ